MEYTAIKELTVKIKVNEDKFGKNTRINTRLAVKQGLNFIGLKTLSQTKGKTRSFGKYNKETFPHLLPRTIQRYMKLAKHVALDTYPVLSVLSQNKLSTLTSLSKENDIGEYLVNNNFDLDFDPTNFEEATIFIGQVNSFIALNKTSTKRPQKKTDEQKVSIQDAVSKVFEWTENRLTLPQKPLSEKVTKKLNKLLDLLNELLYPNEDEK